MIHETVKLSGHINFKLFDETGKLKEERSIKNVVVTVGKAYLANWLTAATQSGPFMSYIGLGTGSNVATIADTALQTELPTRVQGTLSNISNVWQNQVSFGPGINTGSISESGIFSDSTLGTMLARQTFSAIPKNSLDTLEVTWQITFA